jgi:YfiH family protein
MIECRVGDARVVFTDRHGGVSHAPYASANLGDHVGDDEHAVAENRARLAAHLAPVPADPYAWVWLRQVHGTDVAVRDTGTGRAPPTADAAVTTRAQLPLVVLTADCAPIALVADGAVGVVHAGWPGLEHGVIDAAVAALRAHARDGAVRAVVGPCVHPGRYEFGADLLARLVARLGPTVAGRTDSGAPALDIPTAVKVALSGAGVDDVYDVGVCTSESLDHFSYRRDGVTGRQALVVVRDP